MKKSSLILITFISLLLSCNNSSNKKKEIIKKESVAQIEEEDFDFLEAIKKVPITPLPIGIESLDSIKVLDYNDFGMRNIPVNYEVDTDDRFGLNSFLNNSLNLHEYDSNLSNVGVSITPVESATIYFSKRLPSKGDKSFLLCKIVQYMGINEEPYIGWILLTVANQHVVGYHQVAQSKFIEERYHYAIFHIDKDFNITVNTYCTSYDLPSSIAYLCGKQHYFLSEEDNSITLDFEEDILTEDTSAYEYDE